MNTLLFSRRTTQACIDRLHGVVTENESKKFVDALNRPGRDRFIKLWEVVVLDALAQLGPIDHEQPLPSGQQPDFAFTLMTPDGPRRVVGDITCISDTGFDEQNPIRALSDELIRNAYKLGVDPAALDLQVEGRTHGAYRDAKMVLELPTKGQVPRFVKRDIVPFLSRIKKAPTVSDFIRIDTAAATLTVGYQPGKQYYSMGHPSYDVSYSIDRNPLWVGLKKKADQLRSSATDSVRVVIVCDGDCKGLKEKSPMGGHFSTKAIVEDYLRRNATIDVVLLLPVVEIHHSLQPSRVEIQPYFATRTNRNRPALSGTVSAALVSHLQRMVDHLPVPRMSAPNAVNRCNDERLLFGLHGGYIWSGHKMSISSKQLLELLAGIPPETPKVPKGAKVEPMLPPNWQEHFLRYLMRGQMISKVTIVSGGETDDDTVEFEFGPPDVAISPFRMPPDSRTS